MDVLSAEGCAVSLRVWRVHRQGCRAFPLPHVARGGDRDISRILAERGRGESCRRLYGGLPHAEAINRGMKILSSSLPSEWLSVYFGGQYHIPGDPKFKAEVPWTDRRVRQAMNMAVNRNELMDNLFKDKGSPMYVSGFAPYLEG